MSQNDNVSGSIFSILAAYTNGLNIFKKLREQRVKGERKKKRTTKSTPKEDGRKKDPPTQSQTKAKVHHGAGHGDKRRKAENQLSKSLREGSRRIRREYDNGCEKAGSRFAIGDGKFLFLINIHCLYATHVGFACYSFCETHITTDTSPDERIPLSLVHC